MPDEIQIINSALTLLRDRRITSLSDGSERSILVGLRYSIVRDAVLERHPWNWAMVRLALAPDPVAPAFGWAYQFVLPSKPWCIKVRDTNVDDSAWEVGLDAEGRRVILSDEEALKIRYTARVEDTNLWSPLAVLALTYLLASDLAESVTGKVGKAQEYERKFEWALSEATLSDSREGSPVIVTAPDVLTAIR